MEDSLDQKQKLNITFGNDLSGIYRVKIEQGKTL